MKRNYNATGSDGILWQRGMLAQLKVLILQIDSKKSLKIKIQFYLSLIASLT